VIEAAPVPVVQRVCDVAPEALDRLLAHFGFELSILPAGAAIPGSYWGEPEAGIRGHSVLVRPDTPVHSLLHETAHLVCMDERRRNGADTDAGGDDLEEAAVCYLQVLLADELPGVGRDRLMRDMDAWGYSFRLGETAAWFGRDAEDALAWLVRHGLLTSGGRPAFTLRQS
jgi:hypothetical protein